MKLARWIFLIASIYGTLFLIPGFFLEHQMGVDTPPVITHPEFYYGFFASALVWQGVFFLISRDPARWRPLMPLAIAEKIAFFAPCMVLYFTGRLAMGGPFIGACIDGVLMCLFFVAWRASKSAPAAA